MDKRKNEFDDNVAETCIDMFLLGGMQRERERDEIHGILFFAS